MQPPLLQHKWAFSVTLLSSSFLLILNFFSSAQGVLNLIEYRNKREADVKGNAQYCDRDQFMDFFSDSFCRLVHSWQLCEDRNGN